jgi:ElaB/YqjD/DUF883 family membrane-anchored ribosome-binding protein
MDTTPHLPTNLQAEENIMPKHIPSSEVEAKIEETTEQLQGKLAEMSDTASAALGRAAGHVEDLTRRTLDRARQTSGQMREQFGRASDATVGYIKDEPVKAVLIAAATGATAALLLSWLSRSRANR